MVNSIHLRAVLYCSVAAYHPDFYARCFACTAVHKRVFSHYTQATDTENITFVFSAVRNTIMQGHLGDYNIT